jgi:hypothetical protein
MSAAKGERASSFPVWPVASGSPARRLRSVRGCAGDSLKVDAQAHELERVRQAPLQRSPELLQEHGYGHALASCQTRPAVEVD